MAAARKARKAQDVTGAVDGYDHETGVLTKDFVFRLPTNRHVSYRANPSVPLEAGCLVAFVLDGGSTAVLLGRISAATSPGGSRLQVSYGLKASELGEPIADCRTTLLAANRTGPTQGAWFELHDVSNIAIVRVVQVESFLMDPREVWQIAMREARRG